MKKPLDYSRHTSDGFLSVWPLTPQNPSDLLLHVLKVVQGCKRKDLSYPSFFVWKDYCTLRGYRYTARTHYESIVEFCTEILEAGHGTLLVTPTGKFKVKGRD